MFAILQTRGIPWFTPTEIASMERSLLHDQFWTLFGAMPEVLVTSPGRAEIIGNHTDYNHGFALAVAIEQHLTVLFRKRTDGVVRLFSTSYPDAGILAFSLSEPIDHDPLHTWTNYPRGVINELLKTDAQLSGADILIDSDLPLSGGISSSAALELAIAQGMIALAGLEIPAVELAFLCQKAENGFVGSPCGFLDQGSIALGQADHFVYLDFEPDGDRPISEHRLVPADLSSAGAQFILAVDPQVKRELGTSGYPARRKSCEDSLSFWSDSLGRSVRSLRDVTPQEFTVYRDRLDQFDRTMRMRCEHIIFENDRVLRAVSALELGDIVAFGQLLTQSGESALRLFELDEQTPELTYLFDTGKRLPGVLGIRNMGGGFSALVLALVQVTESAQFKHTFSQAYQDRFGHVLEFFAIQASDGVKVTKI